MNKATGGPAFPHDGQADYTGGMTLRDYFAAKAMAVIIAADPTISPDIAAEWAYQYADAMLAARGEV